MFSYFQSICNLFGRLFEWRAAEAEHVCESDIIKDKKDYKKATDIAEKIIKIAEYYKSEMTFTHRLRFSRLVEKFKKYN